MTDAEPSEGQVLRLVQPGAALFPDDVIPPELRDRHVRAIWLLSLEAAWLSEAERRREPGLAPEAR